MTGDIIRRSRIASAAAVFMLLGAVLPNVSYLDHVGTGHSHAAYNMSVPREPSGEEHTLHCHTGPAGCAGGQAMVGAIWVGEDSALITPSLATRTSSGSAQQTPPEAPVLRILEPPRSA